jgi:hypothetical protein
VGPFDAEVFEKIFFPTFIQEDLVNLSFAQIYLTLSIDGVGSKPFSAVTLPPIMPLDKTYADEVIASSRKKYARPFSEVEKIIFALHNDNTNSSPQSSGQNNQKNNFSNNGGGGNNQKVHNGPATVRNNTADYKNKPQAQTQSPTNDKAFSLLNLKKKEIREDTKSTGKHKDDLRNALADLMKNSQSEEVEKPKVDRNPVSNPVGAQQTAKHNSDTTSSNQKSEVPENVLRDMLKVHDK